MRKLIILTLLAISFSSVNSLAQDSTNTTDFQFKKHAMQFQVYDMFRISGFQGSLISYKYHFNNKMAFRFGVGLSANTSNGEDYRKNVSSDSTGKSIYSQQNNLDRSAIDIIFTSQFLYYFNPERGVKLYAGLGPYFTYLIRDNDTKYSRNRGTDLLGSQINDQDYTKLGLSASYGLEWFFAENISLLAEYGFLLYYYERITETRTNETNQEQETDYRKTKEDGWIFDESSVKLGLTVYF